MDTRELGIIIGQAINLAHAEMMHKQTNDDWMKNRIKEIVTISLEARKELMDLRPKMGAK